MPSIDCRVWIIGSLESRFLILFPIHIVSSTLRQIYWWQLLLVLIGCKDNIVVQPWDIVLVTYNLVPLILPLIIVAVFIIKCRVWDTHRRAHATRPTSLSLQQMLFTIAAH